MYTPAQRPKTQTTKKIEKSSPQHQARGAHVKSVSPLLRGHSKYCPKNQPPSLSRSREVAPHPPFYVTMHQKLSTIKIVLMLPAFTPRIVRLSFYVAKVQLWLTFLRL